MSARNIDLNWDLPAFAATASFYQGEAATLTLTRSTTTTILGWTIVAYVKQFHGDTSYTLTISGTITSAANGIFTLALTAAQTGAMAYQSYWCEIWRTDSGSETLMSLLTLNVLEGLQP